MSLFGISLDPISDLSSVLGNNNPISTTISGITGTVSGITSGLTSDISGITSGISSLASSLFTAATNLTNGLANGTSSLASLIEYLPYILLAFAGFYAYSVVTEKK